MILFRTSIVFFFLNLIGVLADEHDHAVSAYYNDKSPIGSQKYKGKQYYIRNDNNSIITQLFQYEDKEEVVLWMNTVGPYHNRQETYAYFSLPFCQGPKQTISHYHETLGEALQGTELEFSGLEIEFKGECLHIEYKISIQSLVELSIFMDL